MADIHWLKNGNCFQAGPVLACALAAALVTDFQPAHGAALSIYAGPSAAMRALSPNFGAEVSYGIRGYFEAGLFLDETLQTSSSSGGSGSISFYGGLLRLGTGFLSSAFLDFKTGFARSSIHLLRSNTSMGFGTALGYRHQIAPFLQLSPRLGYRWIPQSFTGTGGPSGRAASFLDFNLLLSVGF